MQNEKVAACARTGLLTEGVTYNNDSNVILAKSATGYQANIIGLVFVGLWGLQDAWGFVQKINAFEADQNAIYNILGNALKMNMIDVRELLLTGCLVDNVYEIIERITHDDYHVAS